MPSTLYPHSGGNEKSLHRHLFPMGSTGSCHLRGGQINTLFWPFLVAFFFPAPGCSQRNKQDSVSQQWLSVCGPDQPSLQFSHTSYAGSLQHEEDPCWLEEDAMSSAASLALHPVGHGQFCSKRLCPVCSCGQRVSCQTGPVHAARSLLATTADEVCLSERINAILQDLRFTSCCFGEGGRASMLFC